MPGSNLDINKSDVHKSDLLNKSNDNANVLNRDIKNVLCNDMNEVPIKEETKLDYANRAFYNKKHTNIYKKYHINSRYDRVRELLRNPNDEMDRHFFKRIATTIKNHSTGCLWGLLDGALSGYLIGVKFGGHGGWIVGGLSQIGSMILAMSVGLVTGAINGIFTNREEVSLLIRDHRYAIGSTLGEETIKPSTDLFPSYDPPNYLTKGDRKNINYY